MAPEEAESLEFRLQLVERHAHRVELAAHGSEVGAVHALHEVDFARIEQQGRPVGSRGDLEDADLVAGELHVWRLIVADRGLGLVEASVLFVEGGAGHEERLAQGLAGSDERAPGIGDLAHPCGHKSARGGRHVRERSLAEDDLGFEEAHAGKVEQRALLGGQGLHLRPRRRGESEVRHGVLGGDGAACEAREELEVGADRLAVEAAIGGDVERAAPAAIAFVDEANGPVHGLAAAFEVDALALTGGEQIFDGNVGCGVRHRPLLGFSG